MRGLGIVRFVAMASLALGLLAGDASADLVRYAWSGRVEPAPGAENPWFLQGDGSALTPNDGTPFTLEVLVDPEALDEDGSLNPGFAEFRPVLAVLDLDGHVPALVSPVVQFSDDAFSGLFDSISFRANAELFGTTLFFLASVRLEPSTFSLASPAAPDPPPVFADTLPIQFGGSNAGDLLTLPENAPVTGELESCPGPPPAEWNSPTSGVAESVELVLEDLGAPLLDRFPLRGSDFAAGELCSDARLVSYTTGSDWSLALSRPVGALLLYAKFWRGAGGGSDPVLYDFDAPFTVVSGIAAGTVSNGGTRLSLPGSAFHDGILRFEGPIASLAATSSSDVIAYQGMTFAVVPEPGAGAGAAVVVAVLVWLVRRRRVSRGVRRQVARVAVAASLLAASGAEAAPRPGDLLVTDEHHGRVLRVVPSTGFVEVLSPRPGQTNHLQRPTGIAVSRRDRSIYVLDSDDGQVVRIDPVTGAQSVLQQHAFIGPAVPLHFPGTVRGLEIPPGAGTGAAALAVLAALTTHARAGPTGAGPSRRRPRRRLRTPRSQSARASPAR